MRLSFEENRLIKKWREEYGVQRCAVAELLGPGGVVNSSAEEDLSYWETGLFNGSGEDTLNVD